MENTQKIKKTSLVLLVSVSLILLYHLILLISSFAAHGFVLQPTIFEPDSAEVIFNPVKTALYYMQTLIMLSVQLCAVI
jgi:hypothetical protein